LKERRIGHSGAPFCFTRLQVLQPRIRASTFRLHALKRAPVFENISAKEQRLAKAKTKVAVSRKAAKTPVRAVKAPKKAAATKPAKASAAKPAAAKAATEKTARKTTVLASPRKMGPLTLPVAAKAADAPAARPSPVVRKTVEGVPRADLPPADGFTLLVDGHFKNCFDDLKGAKAAASELKSRFPMLRVEIYDAAKKTRLTA
jgi:hypothetical protein